MSEELYPKLRATCALYDCKDIFNMDETGLNWKLTPDQSLATQAAAGSKKSKDRITLAITSNADGSEKLQHWVIGKSTKPRCFKSVNLKLLGVEYRNNKTKWMTGVICEEFLRAFDRKMRGRKVLLLMDNFSGHELAVTNVGGLDGLTNVKVRWLSPNTTPFWQPMDQGIIAAFKLQYRKIWVLYMLQEYEADRDPQKTVNLLYAIQWSVRAWEKVTCTTIKKCWYRSTCIIKPDSVEAVDLSIARNEAELQAQLERLPIAQLMDINRFLNPPEEQIVDVEEDIIDVIVERYTVEEDDDEESEDEAPEALKVTRNEAVKALELLNLYELQQKEGNSLNLQALHRMVIDIQLRKQEAATQQTIVGFFGV
jgi:hypothetical protein